MRVQKITLFNFMLVFWLLFISTEIAAQGTNTPTVTAKAPTNVTYRTTMTITGTNFANTGTSVSFYASGTTGTTVTPLAYTYVSPTQLTVVVPSLATSGSAAVTRYFIVSKVVSGTTYNSTPASFTYTPPAQTPSAAVIDRIITSYNGYWNTTTAAPSATQPDNQHSLYAFRYNGTLYSTGNDAIIANTLNGNAGTGTYTQGNWRAIPVNNIAGNNPGAPVYLVLGGMIDGSATTSVHTAPSVQGLSARDVLIDGTRGLGLGTGITNLPSTSPLTFTAGNILQNKAGDAVPDIMVTQVADPTTSNFTTYCFVDTNGNIVGNPVEINMSSIAKLGTYKSDFFTLQSQSFNTAVVNGVGSPGGNTRDIRILAYKLSDFGITETNRGQVTQFKVLTNGTDDMAFMAYNRDTFTIPAPEIVSQPVSQAVCPGSSASFTISVTSTGSGTETPVYQWERNGIALTNGGSISGANTATLTINPVAAADAGIYRCVVTNSVGAAFSNSAYLNSVLLSSSTSASTCQNIATTIEASAIGNNPQYQWYMTANNGASTSTTGGTAISGATGTSYSPAVAAAGTKYYYVQAYPQGSSCAAVTSPAIPVTVAPTAVAGTVTPDQLICYNSTTAITLSGYTGAIQWQQSANGTTGWVNVTGGSGANSATYTTPALTEGTYYRAVVSSGGCSSATSGTVHINVNISYIWVGTTSVNWNTASNWSCNLIPTSAINVTIPAAPVNQPTVNNDGTAFAKTLVIEAGAHLTVATGATIQVVNEVTVTAPGTMVVENNGALIQDNQTINTGDITVKRDSNPLYRLDYTLWSSPVSGQKLRTFSMGTSNNRFYEYKYDTPDNGATYNEGYWPVDPLTTYFTAAKGILIRMPNSNAAITGYAEGTGSTVFNGVFTGTPYNGTIQVPLSVTGDRYTATGNPYASPISIKSFFTQNAGVLQAGSPIYVWRKKNNYLVSSYATITLAAFVGNTAIWETTGLATPEYTSGGQTQAGYFTGNSDNWLISQGQGFLVKTSSTATSSPMLTFTNSMRKPAPQTGTQSFFKSAAAQPSRLWLNLENGSSFSQLAVAYIEGQTLDLDYGYDGLNMGGDGISIYTLAGESNLTIQSRPEFDVTDVVPVGYTASTAGSHTISLDHTDGVFASGQKIYIRDKSEGVTRDLTQYDYTFTTEAGTINNRFELIYTTAATPALGTDTPVLDANNVIVFKENNTVKINSGATVMHSVTIFDIRGRVLYSQDKINTTEATVSNLAVQQEVIIVEVTTEKGKVAKKVIF